MNKQWYIIQLVPGNEEFVKTEILKRVEELNLQEYFGDILIPRSKTINAFSNEEGKIEQLFPGYMIVQIVPTHEIFRLIYTVPRVYKFLGGENPSPLTQTEIDNILEIVSGKIVTSVKTESMFSVGSEIEMSGGPFAGFSGTINSIDEIKQKMIINVSIFGRLTPVEITFDQIKL